MKGAPTLGFYVNKTIYAFPTLDPIPGITVPNPKPTQLYF
jgi:hypothetical protein